jgi:hypothetical protein
MPPACFCARPQGDVGELYAEAFSRTPSHRMLCLTTNKFRPHYRLAGRMELHLAELHRGQSLRIAARSTGEWAPQLWIPPKDTEGKSRSPYLAEDEVVRQPCRHTLRLGDG